MRASRSTRCLLAGLALAVCGCGADRGGLPRLEELNVLLIVVDTFGAEHAGYVDPRLTHTPHLDALAGTGVAFTRAYSPAPWTQPAFASLYTSLMPSRHGLLSPLDVLAPERDTLAERLRARGFRTGAVTAHPLLLPRYGFAQGFEFYDSSASRHHEGISSHRVTDRAIAWLDRHGGSEPFFLLAHYLDPHYVYHHHPAHDLTSGYAGRLRPGQDVWELRAERPELDARDVAYLVGLHREEIAFADAQVGRLLAHLRGAGLEDRTLVILTSDHGEEIMRHGWIGHTRTLYDELLHVPLVVSLPGALAPRVVAEPVSLLDLLPTLLALSSDPPPPSILEGRSLLPLLAGRGGLGRDALFAEVSYAMPAGSLPRSAEKTAFQTALLRPGPKLVHDLLADRWRLYDRDVDPEELADRYGEDPAAPEMRAALEAWERARPEPSGHAGRAQPTAEELETLRALGYAR